MRWAGDRLRRLSEGVAREIAGVKAAATCRLLPQERRAYLDAMQELQYASDMGRSVLEKALARWPLTMELPAPRGRR